MNNVVLSTPKACFRHSSIFFTKHPHVTISTSFKLLDFPHYRSDRLQAKGDVDLNKKLDEWEQFYNFARPHGAHQGRTPYESLREKLT
jgi:hypothetical protein